MIYLFHGNSPYLLRKNLHSWKEKFIEKYGDINLTHIKNIDEYDINFLNQILHGGGLFGEKKMIIIEGIPPATTSKDKHIGQILEKLIEILNTLDKSVLLVFASINPDKRGKFYKSLIKKAKGDSQAVAIKEFNIKNENDALNFLYSYYQNIDRKGIQLVLQKKGGNLDKAISEIEKILIAHENLDSTLIEKTILPELDESIFSCIESIVSGNIKTALEQMEQILQQSETIPFYYGLISNLRTILYVALLQDLKIQNTEISSLLKLGNRSFLIDKYKYANTKKLQKLYKELLKADTKMKTGKLSNISGTPLKDEIECIFLANM